MFRWSFMSVVQSSYRGPHDSNDESKKHSVLPVHLCVYSNNVKNSYIMLCYTKNDLNLFIFIKSTTFFSNGRWTFLYNLHSYLFSTKMSYFTFKQMLKVPFYTSNFIYFFLKKILVIFVKLCAKIT